MIKNTWVLGPEGLVMRWNALTEPISDKAAEETHLDLAS